MNPSPPPLFVRPAFRAAPGVAPQAAHALGGIWRLAVRPFYTPLHWLTLAGMLTLLVVFSFAMAPDRGGQDNYLPWVVRFHVCFLVPLLAFISAGGAVRDDLQPGAVDYLFTRPVRRPLYIAFRFLTHVGGAQINHSIALGVLVAVGIYREVPGLGAALPLLLLGQVLMLITFSAFGFLAGMVTSRYVIVGLVYGGLVEVGLGSVPTALNRLSMSRHVLGLLQPLLVDERNDPSTALSVAPFSPLGAVALLLLLAGVLLALTAVLFNWREFHGNAGREP